MGSGHGAYTGPSYAVGDVLEVTVTYDRPVTVTPRIQWDIENSEPHANIDYVSGSSTRWLVFRRTVQSGDLAENLIALNSPLQLNSGTITDATVAANLGIISVLIEAVKNQDAYAHGNASLAEILVGRSTLAVTEGSTGTYTVRLNKTPVGNVVVRATRSDSTIGLQRPGEAARAATETLTFSSTTWNTAQTILVYGEADADAAPGSATITHAVVDAQSSTRRWTSGSR